MSSRRVIAIDRKSVRGTQLAVPHLVAGLDQATGFVLGQVAVDAKIIEIPALRNTAITLLRLTGWTNIDAGLRHHARDPFVETISAVVALEFFRSSFA